MNDDVIYRQAAIDAAIEAADKWDGGYNYERELCITEGLQRVPSAQPVARDINVLSNDLIIRQEAIDQLHQSYNLLDAERRLEDMPSVTPKQHWIPCSERLPEDMQFVLLTVRRLKNAYNLEPFISVGYIGWNQQHWWCAHDGDCEISKVEVIAWMPLPEPFREEGDQ